MSDRELEHLLNLFHRIEVFSKNVRREMTRNRPALAGSAAFAEIVGVLSEAHALAAAVGGPTPTRPTPAKAPTAQLYAGEQPAGVKVKEKEAPAKEGSRKGEKG